MKNLRLLAPLLTACAMLLYAASANASPASDPISASAASAPDGFVLVEDEPVKALTFKAETGDKTFRRALTRWAASAGWSVSWELESEYSFSYSANFGPDFVKAVDGLCAGLNSSGVRARAIVYNENKVVRIVLEGTSR